MKMRGDRLLHGRCFGRGWSFLALLELYFCFIVVGANSRTVSWGVFFKAVVFCTISVVVLGFAYKGVKRFDISWEFLVIGAVFVALLELSLVLLMRVRGKWISRGVFLLKFLVLGGVVGAVVGLAYNGAKHMGGTGL